MELQFFDPEAEYWVQWRRLPHWSQPGTICFITFRTADSMPKPVVARWVRERNEWFLKAEAKCGPASPRPDAPSPQAPPRNAMHANARVSERPAYTDDWNLALNRLPRAERERIKWKLTELWDGFLDECHGACVLRRPELSKIVADSFHHFNGERYVLTDFVVMPNHVHLLAAFPDEDCMLKQCESWKRFTAVRINRVLSDSGEFWQVDGFDHLVRSEEQFQYYRRYIADNPRRAHLKDGEYRHYSKPAM